MKLSRTLFPFVLSVGLLATFAITGAAYAGSNSGNARVCQKGGWASPNLQTGSGLPHCQRNRRAGIEFP